MAEQLPPALDKLIDAAKHALWDELEEVAASADDSATVNCTVTDLLGRGYRVTLTVEELSGGQRE